jgi:hypothetical protein
MFLTFRYRLLPTRGQHRALRAILEGQRQLYNAALEERKGAWEKARKSINYQAQFKSLTLYDKIQNFRVFRLLFKEALSYGLSELSILSSRESKKAKSQDIHDSKGKIVFAVFSSPSLAEYD